MADFRTRGGASRGDTNMRVIAFLAYAMYFLTGISCIAVGSSLPHLAALYNISLDKVVLIQSAYALGRVLTVYISGRMVEKTGARSVLAIGTIFIGIFMAGLGASRNFYLSMVFAVIGGIGMGTQDTVCPVFLSMAYKNKYSSALSAGQGLFGLGSMSFPFIIGMMLRGKINFYYADYMTLAVPVVMLLLLPLANVPEHVQNKSGEQVEPLKTKNFKVAYIAVIVACAAYSAVVNTIGLYTTSLAESIGISSANAAFLLTIYNIGGVAGAFLFMPVLNKCSPVKVLIYNCVGSLVAIGVALMSASYAVYFLCFFIAGFLLVVLFSLIISIATRINYRHISRAGSAVAMSGGLFDILTPMITAVILRHGSVADTYIYCLIMLALTLGAAVVIRENIIHERNR